MLLKEGIEIVDCTAMKNLNITFRPVDNIHHNGSSIM